MTNQIVAIIRNAAPYDFGGGERFPIFLAEDLQKNNLHPVIISRSKKLLAFAEENNIETRTGWWWSKQQWSGLNNLLFPAYLVWQVVLFFYYLVLFTKLNPKVIHIQSKDDFIAATYAGALLKKRVIWTDHADLKHIFQNVSTWYKNPIGKLVYKAAKHATSITVVSKSELSLIQQNIPLHSPIFSKIQVIYNGVIDKSSTYKRVVKKQFTYLIASRLVTDKGIGEALDAFKLLSQEHEDVTLNIIGDGPEAEKFTKIAANIPRVSILGHQSQPLEYMAQSDVFVHPTFHEGFSVALVEASMMSLPIIATSVGGNVEIVQDNKTGILVPSKNSQALYEAMKKLYTDKDLRNKLAIETRKQYLDRFQFNEIVEKNFIPLYGLEK